MTSLRAHAQGQRASELAAEERAAQPGQRLRETLLALIRMVHADNIGSLDLHLDGVVLRGQDAGDWHLTLKRVDDRGGEDRDHV